MTTLTRQISDDTAPGPCGGRQLSDFRNLRRIIYFYHTIYFLFNAFFSSHKIRKYSIYNIYIYTYINLLSLYSSVHSLVSEMNKLKQYYYYGCVEAVVKQCAVADGVF